MNIIPAEKQYLEKLVLLHELLYPDELKEIHPFKWSRRSWIEAHLGSMYVVVEQQSVLGAVCVAPSLAGFEIETLVVGREHQGFGVGRSLVEYAKALARTNGAEKLAVCSFVAYGKKRFYENCGFMYVEEALYESQTQKTYPYHCMSMNL